MEDSRLLNTILNNLVDDDEAIGMIFSNYIDIGGTFIGLTVGNAIKAGKLLRHYDFLRKYPPKQDYYFLNKEESLLFNSDTPIWVEDFGEFHRISAIEVLLRFGVEVMLECDERCVASLSD